MSYFKLPSGVQDILPKECYNNDQIINKLKEYFRNCGCHLISTPGLEYYDTFTKGKGAISQKNMFKLTDNDGSLLVVRPDVTLSVARISASKLKNFENKLCYIENVYEANSSGVSYREVLQAGVEFIGENGEVADSELISTAIESLKNLGLKKFTIDIGHVGLFKGIMEDNNFSNEEVEEIRKLVNAKNLIGVENALVKMNATSSVISSLLALSTLFGGIEVFEKAKDLIESKKALKALESLEKTYKILMEYGYEKYISLDLGLVKNLNYYTGIIFTGLASSVGAPILTGGRYDDLASEFGKNLPAVGFGIGIKRLSLALANEGIFFEEKRVDICVMNKKCEKNFRNFVEDNRKNGKMVLVYNGESEKGFNDFCKEINPISSIIFDGRRI